MSNLTKAVSDHMIKSFCFSFELVVDFSVETVWIRYTIIIIVNAKFEMLIADAKSMWYSKLLWEK